MRTILLACGAVMMLMLAGCSKDPEDGMVDTLDEIGNVLEDVKTKSDAESVKARIGELVKEYVDYAKQLREGDFSTEKGLELAKRSGPALKRIFNALRKSEVAQVLKAELAKLTQ